MKKALGALAAGGAAWVAYQAACPVAQAWGRGFHRGSRAGDAFALTFDDGPAPATPAILDRLGEAGARATFFVCGRNVERDPDPARRAVAEGHEIGNHTFDHPFLLGMTSAAIRRQVLHTQAVIEDRLGVSPRLFRPPYGVRAPGLARALEEAGLTAMLWTVIGADWRLPATRIAERVLAKAEPGGVACLHDGRALRPAAYHGQTVEALESILPALRAAGLRTVTGGEVLAELTRPLGAAAA